MDDGLVQRIREIERVQVDLLVQRDSYRRQVRALLDAKDERVFHVDSLLLEVERQYKVNELFLRQHSPRVRRPELERQRVLLVRAKKHIIGIRNYLNTTNRLPADATEVQKQQRIGYTRRLHQWIVDMTELERDFPHAAQTQQELWDKPDQDATDDGA